MHDLNIAPSWTDERVAELRRLWLAGLTMTQVAAALGVTKSAASNKIGRLGLRRGEKCGRRPYKAPDVTLPVKAQNMRRPPRSGNRTPDRQTYHASTADPVEAAAIRANRHAYGKELLEAFKTVPFDAVPLVGRAFGSCAWPVGEPGVGQVQLCCGQRAIEAKPYCATHAAIAFVSHRETVSDTLRKLRKYL
jgi:GcrA cell cycle regulator